MLIVSRGPHFAKFSLTNFISLRSRHRKESLYDSCHFLLQERSRFVVAILLLTVMLKVLADINGKWWLSRFRSIGQSLWGQHYCNFDTIKGVYRLRPYYCGGGAYQRARWGIKYKLKLKSPPETNISRIFCMGLRNF